VQTSPLCYARQTSLLFTDRAGVDTVTLSSGLCATEVRITVAGINVLSDFAGSGSRKVVSRQGVIAGLTAYTDAAYFPIVIVTPSGETLTGPQAGAAITIAYAQSTGAGASVYLDASAGALVVAGAEREIVNVRLETAPSVGFSASAGVLFSGTQQSAVVGAVSAPATVDAAAASDVITVTLGAGADRSVSRVLVVSVGGSRKSVRVKEKYRRGRTSTFVRRLN
jgi:hypothetical protein